MLLQCPNWIKIVLVSLETLGSDQKNSDIKPYLPLPFIPGRRNMGSHWKPPRCSWELSAFSSLLCGEQLISIFYSVILKDLTIVSKTTWALLALLRSSLSEFCHQGFIFTMIVLSLGFLPQFMLFSFPLLNFVLVIFSFRSTQIKTYSWDNAQVILVGNKCDMEDERIISTERGRHLGEQLGKTQS